MFGITGMTANKPHRIGIFGGTFNPVHTAHVAVAREFLEKCDLDLLYIIPNRISPLKNPAKVSPEDRFNMLEIAFRDFESTVISDIELGREGESFTCDTVAELRRLHPDSEFFLLTGDDWIDSFDRWRNYRYILDNTQLVVAYRGDVDITPALDRLESLSGTRPMLLGNKRTTISSTELRSELDRDFLPNGVYEYIKERGLYNA